MVQLFLKPKGKQVNKDLNQKQEKQKLNAKNLHLNCMKNV